MLGALIPFIPNNEYYAEEYYDEYVLADAVNFYTYGNTEAEFEAYLLLFADYELIGTDVDEYGDTWYFYEKGNVGVDLAYYVYEGEYIVDVYAYPLESTDSGDNENEGGSTGNTYTDFTATEKALLDELVGEVIPFAPCTEYYVEQYYDEYVLADAVNFYAYGVTADGFAAYRALFTDYELVGTDVDEYGDTWYFYEKGNLGVDVAYYLYDGEYIVDVYAYPLESTGTDTDDSTDTEGGNTGSGEGGSGNEGGSQTDADVIINDGKGLPTDSDGVYDVDFTEATNVKNVTNQGYYLDGCPTTGSPAVLVIPVDFSDITAESKGYTVESIVNAFKGADGTTDYYSVHDYYYISSYGQLDLDITVLDFWFRPEFASSHYADVTMDYYGTETFVGDQMIMDEALAYLEDIMDLSSFDSDGNGIIDSIVLINTLDIDSGVDFQWAYRYWNIYTDADGYYYEYDNVSANDYLWASYQFLYETSDSYGNVSYDDESAMNTYTYIHEFGHVLGADDYYDTAYVGSPMDGYDIMDSMLGDHNAYTKFNFGWITSSRLVVAGESVTLTLEDFSQNGDTIIIANNWDSTLGAYQEYFVLVYYTNGGLNPEDEGYFSRDGVVVYHVNASLYKEDYEGETYYDVYNNNTSPSDDYGTENNLIELVTSDEGNYTFVVGDSLPTVTDDSGNTLAYTFTVDELTEDAATITFTKI